MMMAGDVLIHQYDDASITAWRSLATLQAMMNMHRQLLDANRDLLRLQQDATLDAISQVFRAWTASTGSGVQVFVQRSCQVFDDFASAVRKAPDIPPPQHAARPLPEEWTQRETTH
nr:hypothetical protein [Roseomonas sp. SXEYE001]